MLPGIIPSFLITNAPKDRNDMVGGAIQLWQPRSRAGPRVDEDKQHYDIFVQAAWNISQHIWSKADEKSIGRNNFQCLNFHTTMAHLRILSLTRLPKRASLLCFKIQGQSITCAHGTT